MIFDDYDWNGAWARLQRTRNMFHDESYWNDRAPAFAGKEASPYFFDFLKRAGIRSGESVFDMGCGSGTFAVPLARDGHDVVAMDFSPGMLARLKDQIARDRLSNLTALLGSWDDDWDVLGVGIADVAIASRSLFVLDMRGALEKLDRAARRRVCVTLSAGQAPHHFDKAAAVALGREVQGHADYVYAFNILSQMGIKAEVSFMGTPKRDIYESREDARAALITSLQGVTSEEEASLDEFLDAHLIPWKLSGRMLAKISARDDIPFDTEGATPVWGVAKDYTRDLRWASISWDKELPAPTDYF